jgi:hypothetical protein
MYIHTSYININIIDSQIKSHVEHVHMGQLIIDRLNPLIFASPHMNTTHNVLYTYTHIRYIELYVPLFAF